jgi:translocation and assembly module TamA
MPTSTRWAPSTWSPAPPSTNYFGGGPWGAAAFVDTGSAFDNSIDLHTGIGFGVHAGARRSGRCADVAHGLPKFQLYLNVGAEF